MWLKAKSKAKLKPELRRKVFLEDLLARMSYLTYSFSDIKLPCCYREVGGMKSVKMFI